MARLARAEVFASDEVAIVHVMNRVTRRCFLLGDDPVTGQNYAKLIRGQVSFKNTSGLETNGHLKVIAVGTAVASGPPHRSVLGELPHTAPTLSRARKRWLGYGWVTRGRGRCSRARRCMRSHVQPLRPRWLRLRITDNQRRVTSSTKRHSD